MQYEVAPVLGQFSASPIDEGIPAIAPFVPLLNSWYEYLVGGAEPPFSGRNNLKTFAMLSAAIESVESGMPVEIAGNPKYALAFKGSQV